MEKRILIVDDDVALSRLLKEGLEKTGKYDVSVQNNPLHALQIARDFRPHLVVLDIRMPVKDGGEVAQELQRDRLTRDIPIIFLTSLVNKNEAEETEHATGGELFIAKPVKLEKLADMIDQVLARKRSSQAPGHRT